MNPCVRTGANVYLEAHNAVFHGDLYVVSDVWVFRYRNIPNGMLRDEADAVMYTQQAEALSVQHPDNTPDMLCLDGDYRTLIIADAAVRCSTELVSYMRAAGNFFDVEDEDTPDVKIH